MDGIQRISGIWGMGGIGKTTIARTVFHQLKKQFDSFSFVQSIQEQLARTGLDQLQQKCLSELLEDKDLDTYKIISSWVKRRLQHKKILLVLDDVDNSMQIEELFKLSDWFGQGSRIIITSRDRQVLKNATPYDGAYETYHVKEMDFHDAFHLFSLKAFKLDKPNNNYADLSEYVMRYCQGNPLAIVVLGCFLYDKGKQEWESALEKLKRAPQQDIFNVLKLSFDRLDEKQKNVFLDLACFFIEPDKLHIDQIDYFGPSANIDISVLIDRSLISVDHNYIVMHDLVKEMGQEIARRQFHEPGKPIRLWKHEDVYRFMRNMETKRIEGISLDMCKTKNIYLKADAFNEMYNLRILKFYKSDCREPSKVYIHQGLQFLPEELRILLWDEFPKPYVPLSFCAENLVDLQMRNSHLRELWDGKQHFPNLKRIDLSGSRCLVRLPDISQAPNIIEILLDGCVNLLQMNSSKCLVKLRILALSECKKLRDAGILHFCNQLKSLYWVGYPFQSLPSTVCLMNLENLVLPSSKLEQLWKGQQHFPNLKMIELSGSRCLVRLPDISQAPNIIEIRLGGCVNLLQMNSTKCLVKLRHLWLSGCKKLRDAGILHFCNQLKSLYWVDYPFQSLPWTVSQMNLENLVLSNSKLEQLLKGQHMPRLMSIDLRGCKDLRELDLSHTPNIREIEVEECVNLDQIHSSISIYPYLISFSHCPKLKRVDFGCNVHQRSSGTLVIGCNYFDLKTLTFNKVTVRFFHSDDGNINAFGFKVVLLQLAEKWDCKDVDQNGELKLLGQTFSSLLPFVGKLRCSNITSSLFSTHYELGLHDQIVDNSVHKNETTLLLWERQKPLNSLCRLYGCKLNCFAYHYCPLLKSLVERQKRMSLMHWKKSERKRTKLVLKNSTNVFLRLPKRRSLFDRGCDRSEEECLKGIIKGEERLGLVPQVTRQTYCDSICKVPNIITRWSLLIDLCLQPSDFGSGHDSFPGLSSLKSLVESDCSMSQHRIDLMFPVASEIMKFEIKFGQIWGHSNSPCLIDLGNSMKLLALFSCF